jgi:hypothetical protein
MNIIYFNEYFKLFYLKGLNNFCCKIERWRIISQSYNKFIVAIATFQHCLICAPQILPPTNLLLILQQFNICSQILPIIEHCELCWLFTIGRRERVFVVPLLVQGLVKTMNSNTTNETLATTFEYVVSWNLCQPGYVINCDITSHWSCFSHQNHGSLWHVWSNDLYKRQTFHLLIL